jgi:hypothetical protein
MSRKRSRLPSNPVAIGFDYDETTHPDLNAEDVRALTHSDPMVMLGKLAASCARTESAIRELTERANEAFKKLTAHEEELRKANTRSNRLTVSAVIVFQVLIQVLQGAGVLK